MYPRLSITTPEHRGNIALCDFYRGYDVGVGIGFDLKTQQFVIESSGATNICAEHMRNEEIAVRYWHFKQKIHAASTLYGDVFVKICEDHFLGVSEKCSSVGYKAWIETIKTGIMSL